MNKNVEKEIRKKIMAQRKIIIKNMSKYVNENMLKESVKKICKLYYDKFNSYDDYKDFEQAFWSACNVYYGISDDVILTFPYESENESELQNEIKIEAEKMNKRLGSEYEIYKDTAVEKILIIYNILLKLKISNYECLRNN